MAENKKSIIEEALLDANRIQEALDSNTKEILRSVAIEEIDGLVRESLNEDDYEEEDVDDTDDLDLADAGGEEDEYSDDEAGEEAGEEETGMDDMDNDEDDYSDEAGMDDMEGGEEMSYDDEESTDDYEMDMTGASDDEVIAVYKKLSGDDEIEVVSDNEVHITDPESGAEYQVKLGGGEADAGMEEYAESSEPMADDEGMEETVYEIALDEEEVSENEITEGEEFGKEIGKTADGNPRTATSDVHMGSESSAPNTGDIEGQKAPVDNETSGDNLEGGFDDDGENGSGDAHADHIMEDEEVNENEETVTEEDEVTENEEVNEDEISEEDVAEGDEVDETKYVGGKVKRVATAHTNKKLENESVESKETVSESAEKYNTLLAEANKLKQQNEEFRGALKKFRKMLGETVVFNTNLTNVTRLFTEHSTTREEKEQIIARFDEEATTIKESKRLYKAIANELTSKKPIKESVENKISKEVNSSQSTSETQLNESTAYVDASTQRIKDLITRVEKPRF